MADSAYLRIMLKPNIRDRQILHIALPSIVSNITVPLGNHGLWLAFNAYMIMRGIAQTIMQRNVYKQHTA